MQNKELLQAIFGINLGFCVALVTGCPRERMIVATLEEIVSVIGCCEYISVLTRNLTRVPEIRYRMVLYRKEDYISRYGK